jgi:hypothetical protein
MAGTPVPASAGRFAEDCDGLALFRALLHNAIGAWWQFSRAADFQILEIASTRIDGFILLVRGNREIRFLVLVAKMISRRKFLSVLGGRLPVSPVDARV